VGKRGNQGKGAVRGYHHKKTLRRADTISREFCRVADEQRPRFANQPDERGLCNVLPWLLNLATFQSRDVFEADLVNKSVEAARERILAERQMYGRRGNAARRARYGHAL
jgi:hypothetical protein